MTNTTNKTKVKNKFPLSYITGVQKVLENENSIIQMLQALCEICDKVTDAISLQGTIYDHQYTDVTGHKMFVLKCMHKLQYALELMPKPECRRFRRRMEKLSRESMLLHLGMLDDSNRAISSAVEGSSNSHLFKGYKENFDRLRKSVQKVQEDINTLGEMKEEAKRCNGLVFAKDGSVRTEDGVSILEVV